MLNFSNKKRIDFTQPLLLQTLHFLEHKLYLIISENSENAFKIAKAGDYFYINLKHILDSRNIDYKSKSIIYDIKKDIEDGIEFFVLTRREKL